MNTLLLAPELFGGEGGVMRMLRLYLKAACELAQAGERVGFVSLNDDLVDPASLRRYTNERLDRWRTCNRGKLKFIGASLLMGRHSRRVICGHIGQLPVAWAISRMNRGVSYFLVAHGIEVWRPFSRLESAALKGAAGIFCVSDYTLCRLRERCPLAEDRFVVLPNALDPFMIPDSPGPRDNGPPVVLSVSRLSKADDYKGIDHLIEAMPAVRSKIPDARLRIVGRGDALEGLRALAKRLGVGDSVEFAGFLSDSELAAEFRRCRLFALPSQREGFGLVYLEAMAHGRPCLGARAGGVPEVITGDTGVLVEYGDVAGIAAAIEAAIRREWRTDVLLARALTFSYQRFRERLGQLLSKLGRVPDL
jgi:glycosyltransferase involved in cell wall biosynthesis